MHDATKLIQPPTGDPSGGRPVRTINPALQRGSTVLFERYEDLAAANAGRYPGVTYGTDRLPVQRTFEQAMLELEGGGLTRAFPSGISAIINTLLAFTRAGDHILVCANAYGPTMHFCETVLARFQVETSVLPADAGAGIAGQLRPNTVLILLESPGSNTFELQDIPAITAIARERGILTVLDATWATPLYLKPFQLGVDVSVQSATKYIAGHSDVLLGVVTVTEALAERFDAFYRVMELFAAPEDCALALRGLKTLPVRLRQHSRSALQVAQWLCGQPLVDQVLHPALPSHPEHHLWLRDFQGASGLFGFTFKEEFPEARLAAFVNALRLFGIGYSWGGFQSLVTAARYPRALPSRYQDRTIVRLSIGLEDPEDLIQDLASAFAVIAPGRGGSPAR
ncbi:MAG: cystathionine beta-lyase [Holophaga sp.]|nr:cystathionine beta-lyase [Holophaga sp.]